MVLFNYKNHSKSGGLYIIWNSYSYRTYIGSTVEFKNRWANGHRRSLLNNKHSNRFLQFDFNKCREFLGHDDFLEFHVLEHMPNSTKEARLSEEEKWLKVAFDQGNRCYNLCDRAISREGIKSKNPEETRRKMSAAHLGKLCTKETKQKMSESQKKRPKPSYETRAIWSKIRTGTKRTEETKRKMSEISKGRKKSETHKKNMSLAQLGKHHTEETKQKLSQMNIGKKHTEETKLLLSIIGKNRNDKRRKPIIGHFQNGEERIFSSISEAARTLGLARENLKRAAAHNKKCGKILWRYA